MSHSSSHFSEISPQLFPYNFCYFSVFLIYAYPRDIIGIMCAANDLGLLNGEYAFLTIDFGLAFHESDMICHHNVTDGELGIP